MKSPVFSSGRLGRLTPANRFVHSATFECMAREDGAITDALVRRYETLARGGVGLKQKRTSYIAPVKKILDIL